MERKLAPGVAIGYRESMASEPYKPAGYCPHCGYAIELPIQKGRPAESKLRVGAKGSTSWD